MNTKALTPRGTSTWTLRRIRAGLFAAAFSLLGLGSPLAAQQSGRAAILLPPQPVYSEAPRTVARGAIDDGPADPLATTPVPRKTSSKASNGPSWLNGPDSSVKPASATANPGQPFERTTPFFGRIDSAPADPITAKKPSMFDRGLEKLRTSFTSTESSAPKPSSLPPMMISRPTAVPRELWDMTPREAMQKDSMAREAPSANSPLQGVTPTGTTVLAGPPAYRWYGYGTTTPGANPYSPSGQYPRASANWYSLTGATPGAFPVPVANGEAPSVGIDPPSYRSQAIARISTLPPESVGRMSMTPPASAQVPPMFSAPVTPPAAISPPTPLIPPSTTKFAPAPANFPAPIAMTPSPKPPVLMPAMPAPVLMPAPTAAPAPMLMPALPSVPTSRTQPTSMTPKTPLLPKLPDGPAITPPPKLLPASGNATVAMALPRIPELTHIPELPRIPVAPVLDSPPKPEALPTAPVMMAPAMPAGPSALPALTTTPIMPVRPAGPAIDEHPWQSTPAQREAGEGWMPADGMPRVQSQLHEIHNVQWQSQSVALAKSYIARGQAPDDSRTDPLSKLIQSLLRGRADGIEVRWNGERKIMVCFEASSNREGSQLVRELSARPELVPYQVDFCVVVK